MGLFWDLYLENKEDRNHPYASPIRAAEFNALPPALLFTSEYDVLRNEKENGTVAAPRIRCSSDGETL